MRKPMKKKVIVAMSGGVDSSVSAALLKKAGFNAIGMFMKCWTLSAESYGGPNRPFAEFQSSCTTNDDERMARLAAAKIGIPFYSLTLVKEYKERVVEYLLEGYRKGITPNPDAMCNKEIKFGLFFDKAMQLGADYVATGHYARMRAGMLMAKDKNKDQSYFLSFIRPEILNRVLFPIGEYTKPEVRRLAKKFGLPNADRKDSQGICFVGKVNFAEFLRQHIPPRPGNIVDAKGNVLGRHEGAWYYTIGQRKGLGLAGGPYFVVDKNVKKNTVVVSKDEKDLLKNEVRVKNMRWFSRLKGEVVQTRIRYRQEPVSGVLKIDKRGTGRVVFTNPQRSVTPGQLAVFYQADRVIAGGIIQ